MQYYAHHIGDFIKDTSNLDDHHLATYLRMIWKYYLDESPLIDSCEDLAFALRSDEKTVQTLLKHFFFKKDGAWVHARCEKVIEDFYNKSEKARASAKARWNVKNMQTQSERIANASKNNANASKSDADSMLPITHNPIPITVSKDTKTLSRPDDVCQDVWDDFGKLRKAKKAPLTKTALNGIQHEADKAEITLEAALVMACNRGWTSFKADWIKESHGRPSVNKQTESFKEKDAKAARELYERVTGKQHPANALKGLVIESKHDLLIGGIHELT
jgi:uncharacterized protein YdaU (DUF1376 family)